MKHPLCVHGSSKGEGKEQIGEEED